jgi:hypothetical protein
MYGTRRTHRPGNSQVSAVTKDPVGAGTSADPMRDLSIPIVVLLASTARPAPVVGWIENANRETTMTSPIWQHHWLQRRPAPTIYQLTDRLHDGHMARVPAHQITTTVSAWLAEVGVHSPLVDDLARAVRIGDWPATYALSDCLSVDVAVAC